MSRGRVVLLAAVVIASALTGCAKEKTGNKEVGAALDATRLDPLRFVYSVSTPDASYQVQGLVEDDFRYKARLLNDSNIVLDEVVNDDAIAVRFAQPALVSSFIDDSQKNSADLSTDLNGVTVIDVLEARRWVLDPAGAPSLTAQSRSVRNAAKDPVFDALGVFAYVEQAMSEAFEVHPWDPEDLNPAYRASEDVFPRPADGSGVKRFDLRRPFLPAIASTSGNSAASVPQTKHFRKMAIYVKNNHIIRVMERVEVTGKSAEDFISYVKQYLKQAGFGKDEIKKFDASLDGLTEKQRSDLLLSGFNEGLKEFGGAPINIRTMSVDLRDIGDEKIVAELPGDSIEGSLAILVNRGKKIEAASASGTPTAPTASSGSGG